MTLENPATEHFQKFVKIIRNMSGYNLKKIKKMIDR